MTVSDETYVFVLKGWSNHKTHRGVLGHYKWGGSVRPQWLPACGARVDVSCLEVTSEPPHPSERCRRCFPKANRRRNGMTVHYYERPTQNPKRRKSRRNRRR